MTQKYKNAQLVAMRQSLEPLLKHTGIIGYTAAKNARKISDALIEYYDAQNDLVRKYGEEEDGEVKISMTSDNFPKFSKEFAPIQNIEQYVDILTLNQDDIINSNLTGEEVLGINWMLED